MNAKWTCKIPALMAAGLFGLAGCGGSSGGEEMGTLSIGLTDGPVDYAENVYVEFTGLELKAAGGPATEYPIDPDACDMQGTAGTCTIDLKKLWGTKQRTLFSSDLLAGEYQWARLLVNAEQDTLDSYVTFSGENEIPPMECSLYIPSGAETGLKIVSGMTVTTNGRSEYMLDFDIRKSITAPPGLASPATECMQNYILKPAIRIVDKTKVGSITGTVDPNLLDGCRDEDIDGIVDHLDVYVFEAFDADGKAIEVTADDYDGEGDPITSAMVKWNGTDYTYEVGYLLEGDYKLGLTCTPDVDEMPNEDPVSPDNFNCPVQDQDPTECEETEPPFVFITEQDATVVVDMLNEYNF